MQGDIGYRTGRVRIGETEHAYLSTHDYTSQDLIGKGAETVNFRKPEDDDVARVFRIRWDDSERTSEERANAVVAAGKVGLSPPAYKVGKRIANQRYVDTSRSLKTIAKKRDYAAVDRIIDSMEFYHSDGYSFGDPASINMFDPASTGGFVTIDVGRFGRIPPGQRRRYILGDLAKTYRDTGEIVLDPIRRNYGDDIADILVDIRKREIRTGENLPAAPLTSVAVPGNDLTLREAA